MNVLLSPQPPLLPHQHESPRQSPSRSMSPYPNMAGAKKRKADDDGDEMSVSPMSSPAIASRQLARPAKKARAADLVGRPLPLPRLLEALDAAQLRTILQTICDHEPAIAQQIVEHAPRLTPATALDRLHEYEDRLRTAMPYGQSSADYNYYRVKHQLLALVDALSDYTRQFLPPAETQALVSLPFLDGATKIIHQLPDWESPTYRQHKEGAYDEIARAWAVVIHEASKKGSGFQLLFAEQWDQVLVKHNQQAGGRLDAAVRALSDNVSWMGGAGNSTAGSGSGLGGSNSNDLGSIRNQLLNGTFGAYGAPVRVGPW